MEYDGTDLHGWQRQQGVPSVQQHLEEAVDSMTGEGNLVTGASRTDAGVHALGQVACFQTSRSIPAHGFFRGINSALPKSIALKALQEVPISFHPRFDSTGKHYQYRIFNEEAPSPLERHRSWHVRPRLDTSRMQDIAYALLGEHDFSAFRATGCTAKTPMRRIDRIEVRRRGHVTYIDVWGNAFLRNMVRIIAGTLVEAERKKWTSEDLSLALKSRDRQKTGRTAPPQGLFLVEVFYPP